MKPEDSLGLYLTCLHTHSSMMVLEMLFGTTITAVAKYLQFAHKMVNKMLKQDQIAKIAIPSYEKLEKY